MHQDCRYLGVHQGLPWNDLFDPNCIHTYPYNRGLEGMHLNLYRLQVKNMMNVLESTWHFSRKSCECSVFKKKKKKTDVHHSPLITRLVSSCSELCYCPYNVRSLGSQKDWRFCGGPGREIKWDGVQTRKGKTLEGSNLHVDRPRQTRWSIS